MMTKTRGALVVALAVCVEHTRVFITRTPTTRSLRMDMAVLTRMAATTNRLQVPDMEPPFRHTLLPIGVGIV